MSSGSKNEIGARGLSFPNGTRKRKSNETKEIGENRGCTSSSRLVLKKQLAKHSGELATGVIPTSSKCQHQTRTSLNGRASGSSRGQFGNLRKKSNMEMNVFNESTSTVPKKIHGNHDEKQCNAFLPMVRMSRINRPQDNRVGSVGPGESPEGVSAGDVEAPVLFTDNEFPPNGESLYGPGGKASVSALPENNRIPLDLIWGRPEKGEIKDNWGAVTEDWVLFRFQPSADDIQQGYLGIYPLIVRICPDGGAPSSNVPISYKEIENFPILTCDQMFLRSLLSEAS